MHAVPRKRRCPAQEQPTHRTTSSRAQASVQHVNVPAAGSAEGHQVNDGPRWQAAALAVSHMLNTATAPTHAHARAVQLAGVVGAIERQTHLVDAVQPGSRWHWQGGSDRWACSDPSISQPKSSPAPPPLPLHPQGAAASMVAMVSGSSMVREGTLSTMAEPSRSKYATLSPSDLRIERRSACRRVQKRVKL